ncbi:hypothetical protein GCM10027176_48520 [Actinoallomurus bryophytorum]|uniref:Lipoprotein n=1 Tax=Actinoallomurus bryophytorum TaxID=1490222 RepID=A0A543CRY2_9ACTN|nr:hypothetical protein [Actinoallomurus bryophytorum]TQL99861.1 hypothetical protein FB559_5562 [Actinoallomurus bryophytorum]
MRTVLIAAAAAATLTLTGCAATVSGAKSSAAEPPRTASSGPATSSGPEAKAKLTGTCDYDLGSSGMGTDYTVSAEVVVKNTGNISIKSQVTARWPQFGHAPVAMSKTVTVGYHKTVIVRFARHATQVQIDRLQSYQLKHLDDDGCSYKGKILETSGAPH